MDVFSQFAFEDIIRVGIASVVILASLVSMAYIIWGGFLMIISGGNEEKIKPAINHIRHSVLGFVFIFLVIFIFPVIMNLLGLPYGEYAKPSTVFATITELFSGTVGDVNTLDGSPTDSELPPDFSDF